MIDPQQTVADLVLDHSECAPVFQQHRIDFCCRGGVSIAEAARARGMEPDALIAALSQAIEARRGDRAVDARSLTTPQLVAHIVARHHAYLRTALPFVGALATKVARVHGDHNPKLRELEAAVAELVVALLPHLDEEEAVLFPALVAPVVDRAIAEKALGAMHEEHLAVALLLERARVASDDYALPAWACNSYRALFSELEQVEGDTFTHVHLENHVLKPRFVEA